MALYETGRFYMPGELVELEHEEDSANRRKVLGPGLNTATTSSEHVVATVAGRLRCLRSKPSVYFIVPDNGRYKPMNGDHVVGTITYRSAEAYRVDFGGPEQASLPMLNFEGATKRLRPDGKVGDTVYCRLIIPNRDMEPDATCVEEDSLAHGMGILPRGGTIARVPLITCLVLRLPKSTLREQICKQFACELVVGMNGRVLVLDDDHREVIALLHILEHAHKCTTDSDITHLINTERVAAQQIR